MKALSSIGVMLSFVLICAGCEAPSDAPKSGERNMETSLVTSENTETSLSTKPEDVPAPSPIVRLKSDSFPGVLVLRAGEAQKTTTGFQLPVFLENVREEDGLDTITLAMKLPEDIRLKTVDTPLGYTVQLDKLATSTPTLHYYPFSSSGDSYLPVTSSQDPVFTLEFSGALSGNVPFSGLFFQTNGTLHRTPERMLSF